jgi:hypothetical protein
MGETRFPGLVRAISASSCAARDGTPRLVATLSPTLAGVTDCPPSRQSS